MAVILTVVPALAAEAGTAESITALQVGVTACATAALYASHLPEWLLNVPALLASRTQTEKRYVPGARPVVLQLKVALLLYAWASLYRLAPGASTQNS